MALYYLSAVSPIRHVRATTEEKYITAHIRAKRLAVHAGAERGIDNGIEAFLTDKNLKRPRVLRLRLA